MTCSVLTACRFATAATAVSAQADAERLAEAAAFFASANIVTGADIVGCTLSDGTETTCFSITATAGPQSYTSGPWCPTNISDGAAAGGIWLQDGGVHDVDGICDASVRRRRP